MRVFVGKNDGRDSLNFLVEVAGHTTHLAYAVERLVRRARIYQQDPHLRFTIDFTDQVLKAVLDRVFRLEHQVDFSYVLRRHAPLRPAIQVPEDSVGIGDSSSYVLPDRAAHPVSPSTGLRFLPVVDSHSCLRVELRDSLRCHRAGIWLSDPRLWSIYLFAKSLFGQFLRRQIAEPVLQRGNTFAGRCLAGSLRPSQSIPRSFRENRQAACRDGSAPGYQAAFCIHCQSRCCQGANNHDIWIQKLTRTDRNTPPWRRLETHLDFL